GGRDRHPPAPAPVGGQRRNRHRDASGPRNDRDAWGFTARQGPDCMIRVSADAGLEEGLNRGEEEEKGHKRLEKGGPEAGQSEENRPEGGPQAGREVEPEGRVHEEE